MFKCIENINQGINNIQKTKIFQNVFSDQNESKWKINKNFIG